MREFQRKLRDCCEREEFRVLHYSVQRDHVHFVVEAENREALGRGMKSVAARLARAVNRAYDRTGAVLDDRYHVRLLRSPREFRAALAYVLLNARRHWFKRFGAAPPVGLDEASSGRWLTGWRVQVGDLATGSPEIAMPRTWIARDGWKRHGLLDPASIPGVRRPISREG